MIEVNNLTHFKIDNSFLIDVTEEVLKGENQDINLSIALVKPREIKKLNKDYRKKNQVTDVLSFNSKEIPEVILCLKKIKKNAKIGNDPFRKELAFCLIHGILHILGYDHELGRSEELVMQEKENHYLQKIFK